MVVGDDGYLLDFLMMVFCWDLIFEIEFDELCVVLFDLMCVDFGKMVWCLVGV